jgi:hypothetical protein
MEVVHHYCNCFLVYGCSISLVISLKITKVTILLSLLQLLMVEFVLNVKLKWVVVVHANSDMMSLEFNNFNNFFANC